MRFSLLRMAALGVLALAIQAPSVQADVVAPAQAVHTAAHVRRHAPRDSRAHRRHLRHRQRPSVDMLRAARPQPVDPAPLPRPADRRNPHPRAALPSVRTAQTHRISTGFKGGHRHAQAACGTGLLMASGAGVLDEDQNDRPNAVLQDWKDTRGPPRARLQASAVIPPATQRLLSSHAAPSPHSISNSLDASSAARLAAAPCREGCFHRSDVQHSTERPSGPSRASQSEGTAARIIMPSSGGTP